MRGFVIPPALRPGSRVAAIAPSGPFPPVAGLRGLAWLRQRYRVELPEFRFAGFLAGNDQERATELNDALANPEVQAIFAFRGGYGANRICGDVNWRLLAEHPKWIIGFSDITAIHAEASAMRVCSLHGPNLARLGKRNAAARAQVIRALEEPERVRQWNLLPLWQGAVGDVLVGRGETSGPLVGGNLTVLQACAAAGRLHLPEGAIVLLEDVTEKPYRIDRMLTTLLQGGHLRGARGIVLGDFTECDAGPDGVTVEEVLVERLGALGIPVARGLPAGHGEVNEAVMLGATGHLRVDEQTATLVLEPPNQGLVCRPQT